MTSVNEPQQSGASGWTPAKVLGLIIGLLLMVGFGACGLCGLAFMGSFPGDPTVLGLSLAGFAIATGGFFLVRKMIRLAREPPSRYDP
jgi:hypothetical protein